MSLLTRGAKVTAEISVLLRARNTLLWVVSVEETRVEKALVEAAASAKFAIRFWDCASGITDEKGDVVVGAQDPSVALDFIREDRTRCVYVLRDLHVWKDPVTQRKLRNLAKSLTLANPTTGRALIVLTPSADLPVELTDHAIVIDYPIPDRAEIAGVLDVALTSIPETYRAAAAPNGARDAAIDGAVGLTAQGAENCYARSLATDRTIDPALISAEKKRAVGKAQGLSWMDPDVSGLDSAGGLGNVKAQARKWRAAFSEKARAYGLPTPRGMLLVGVSGCGKTLAAKCLGAEWKFPVLRADLGAAQSKFVGESQTNLRKIFATAEAAARRRPARIRTARTACATGHAILAPTRAANARRERLSAARRPTS